MSYQHLETRRHPEFTWLLLITNALKLDLIRDYPCFPRSLPGCTVFYPSDAVSTERAVELAANTKGICFIRLSRPATPIVYENDKVFKIGEANVIKKSDSDKVWSQGFYF